MYTSLFSISTKMWILQDEVVLKDDGNRTPLEKSPYKARLKNVSERDTILKLNAPLKESS